MKSVNHDVVATLVTSESSRECSSLYKAPLNVKGGDEEAIVEISGGECGGEEGGKSVALRLRQGERPPGNAQGQSETPAPSPLIYPTAVPLSNRVLYSNSNFSPIAPNSPIF